MAVDSIAGGSMSAVIRTGAEGMRRGAQRFSEAAERVVETLEPEAMIESKLAETETKAGIAVVKRADDMLGQLIDELG